MRMCKAISKVVMSIPLPARILAKCKDTQTEDQTVSAKRLLIAVTDSCLPSHQTDDQTVSACLSVTP